MNRGVERRVRRDCQLGVRHQRLHQRPRSVAAQRHGASGPGDWGFGASIQQEILPRVSVELGYNRRWLTNFTWDDNVLQATGDFKSFTVVAPTDSRLGDASGQTSGLLYNANPNVSALTNNVTKLATDAGGQYSQVYNGFLFNVSARPRSGLVFQGGFRLGNAAQRLLRGADGITGVHRPRLRRTRPTRGATRPRAS